MDLGQYIKGADELLEKLRDAGDSTTSQKMRLMVVLNQANLQSATQLTQPVSHATYSDVITNYLDAEKIVLEFVEDLKQFTNK